MDVNYKLDIANSQILQISNDAFWYLYQDEEMLDDLNMQEVDTLWHKFPEGFYIDDDYTINTDGTVTCKIVPYIKDTEQIQWDGENITLNKKGQRFHVLKFKVLDKYKCLVEWLDELHNSLFYKGECEIVYFDKNPWCKVNKSLIPLCGKQVKYFRPNCF